MKEKIKYIIIFIAGIIISTVTSVYAATVITAGEVSYTSNSNTTVQTGLDNLYTKANTMANDVTALKAYSTGTVTAATNFTKSSLNNLSKKGNVVQVSITGYTSAQISAGTKFATIPSGYIPKNQLIIPVIFSGSGKVYNGSISTSGSVYLIDNAIPASTWITLSATYIAD